MSKKNLSDWLDAVIRQLNLERTYITDENSDRVPGFYAHMRPQEIEKVKAVILNRTNDWGKEAKTNGMTCGAILLWLKGAVAAE